MASVNEQASPFTAADLVPAFMGAMRDQEHMSWWDYIVGEAWYAGAYGGGYDKSRPWLGYLRLVRGLLPRVRIGRFEGQPFIELTATQIPMRVLDYPYWTLAVLVQRHDHGWSWMWMKGEV